MIISGAKIQKTSEETYQATLLSQSLLKSVQVQIEKDLKDERWKKLKKGKNPDHIEAKDWLEGSTYDDSLINFLSDFKDPNNLTGDQLAEYNQHVSSFQEQFKTDQFLYEVHLWAIEKGGLKTRVPDYSFVQSTVSQDNISDLTMINLEEVIKDHFDYKDDPLLWTKPADFKILEDDDIRAIAEIRSKGSDEISIRGNGIKLKVDQVGNLGVGQITEIPDYGSIDQVIRLTYERYEDREGSREYTHRLLIDKIDSAPLEENHIIHIGVDQTTFTHEDPGAQLFKIENNTDATVIISVYTENNSGDHSNMTIFPIQHKTKGQTVVEYRERKDPYKNFIIGIIVRDRCNSTFGEKNKILSKLVDVYSYDYNK